MLLEAVPPEVAAAVVEAVDVPVIGCGAGPACHGSVIVTHDALGFNAKPPRFVPKLDDLATAATAAYATYVRRITDGSYPAAEHNYVMPPDERRKFLGEVARCQSSVVSAKQQPADASGVLQPSLTTDD